MADFNVRSDAVDVDDIMRQIRARIREKRGVDYTDADVTKLASVKLETFLDPKGIKSDLVDRFRRGMAGTDAPAGSVDVEVIYGTKPMVRRIRWLLNPILKLFFSPSALLTAVQVSAAERREQDILMYELVHNLVVETTRLGIEVHNMKMRLESLSGRLDFDERRGRALENVVQYKPPSRPDQRPPQRPDQRNDQRNDQRSDQRQDQRNQRSDRPRSEPRPNAGNAVAAPAPPIAPAPAAANVPTAAVADVPPNGAVVSAVANEPMAPAVTSPTVESPRDGAPDGERRRRRRRRRRRPGQNMAGGQNTGAPSNGSSGAPGATDAAGGSASHEADDDGPDDGAAEE